MEGDIKIKNVLSRILPIILSISLSISILLLLIFLFSEISYSAYANNQNSYNNNISKVTIYFCYSITCPHCAKEKIFLRNLEEKYPRLDVDYIIASENQDLFKKLCSDYNTIPVGVPRTFIGDKVFIGFTEEEGSLEWYDAYKAYYGYSNQIENEIRKLMDLAPLMCECEVLKISKRDESVSKLLEEYPESKYSVYLINETYLVGWWSPDRINSNIDYPNVVAKVNARTGEIIESWIPDMPVEGLKKPTPSPESRIFELIIPVFLIYGLVYIIFRNKVHSRYWISGLSLLVIASLFVTLQNISEKNIIGFAKGFSFPGFTFIIALIDGFNPCAFAVLAFLLSLLTYTRSRKKMLLIGSVFILTSGFMYFLFIMLLLIVRATMLSEFQDIMRLMVGLIAIIAGIINIKDFFFFGRGISLTMSDDKRNRIFGRIGRIVQGLRRAESKREIIFAVIATFILAIMVNIIELGCTFILPVEYIEVLLNNYPEPIGLTHIFFTAFYGLVYIIPLFAILGSFIYSFKSERLTERQGRILKLFGGIIMVSLGLILIFKPEILIFK